MKQINQINECDGIFYLLVKVKLKNKLDNILIQCKTQLASANAKITYDFTDI